MSRILILFYNSKNLKNSKITTIISSAIPAKRLFLVLISDILFITAGWAQTGILRGKVIDAETGEELIGAAVVVTGTTQGTITDFDGNYTLSNLDPGTVSITVQYISYESQEFPDVVIQDSDVTLLVVNMGRSVIAVEEVQVVARARQRTEASLMVMQRKSGTVLDGISSQQISRLGDGDAASALKRVTGISVEGGKYVYIRGLSDRYSKTTLNGAEIPGLDPNKNAVQMDLFPANLIENMIVHKVFSPDLPGDFTGGNVDIITSDFPSRFTLQLSSSLGYNPGVNLNKNFITYQGGKKDWLGMDDGTRAFPTGSDQVLPDPYFSREENALLGDVSRGFTRILDFDRKKPFLNQGYSLAIGDQVPIWLRSLGYNVALSYSKDFDYYDNGQKNFYEVLQNGSPLNPKKLTDDELGDEKVIWSSMLNTSLRINSNHKIGLRFMHNQSGQASTRYNRGSEPDESRFIEERTLGYLERAMTTFQLNGKHVMPKRNTLNIEWFSSYTSSRQNEPDFRQFFNDYDPLGIRANKEPKRDMRELEEASWDTKIHFTLPFRAWDRSARFKFGGSFVMKDRVSSVNMFSLTRQGKIDFTGNPETYVADENFITGDELFPFPVLYYKNDGLTNQVNSYVADQEVYAAYAMVDIPVLEKLRFVTGVRYELSTQFVENEVDTIEYNPTKYSSGEGIYRDLLPSFNLTWSIFENMNLRLGYNRTLARPVFRELAPYASWDYKGGFRVVGNPDLKRTLIDNLDLRWEYYFAPGEVVSLSGFYKYFNSPIEQRDEPITNNPEIHYENIADSRLYGVETELRKSLDFISVLRDFEVGANITFIHSEMEEDSAFLASARMVDSIYPAKREMFGQSPFIINANIGYQNDSIGLRANLAFNVSGPKIVLITKGGLPNVYEQPLALLDFNISKSFGDRWAVKFSVKNILNSAFKQTYTFEDVEYYFLGYKPGREFKIGITYLIK